MYTHYRLTRAERAFALAALLCLPLVTLHALFLHPTRAPVTLKVTSVAARDYWRAVARGVFPIG